MNVLDSMRQRIRREMLCKTDKEEIEKWCDLIRISRIDEDERRVIVALLDDISSEIPQVEAMSMTKLCIESLRQDLANGGE